MGISAMMMPPTSSRPASSSECACGCGNATRPPARYIRGHNIGVVNTLNREVLWITSQFATPSEEEEVPPLSGEQKLMFAQLRDAVHHRQTCTRAQCPQCWQDRCWAMATAAWGVFSFVNVCDYTGVNWWTTRQWFLATAR